MFISAERLLGLGISPYTLALRFSAALLLLDESLNLEQVLQQRHSQTG
jgi:hypothetical protein